MKRTQVRAEETTERLLDAREVASWLGIAISTVYDQAARGVLPHVALWRGHRRTVLRFRRCDIERFLLERSVTSRRGRDEA